MHALPSGCWRWDADSGGSPAAKDSSQLDQLANAEICDDIDDIIANGADTLRAGASAVDVVEPTAGFRAGSLMTKFGADGRVEAINLAWRCSLLALP